MPMTMADFFQMGNDARPLSDDDYVVRMRKWHAAQESPRESFTTTKVKVEDGPVDEKGRRQLTEVTLRYAIDSPYIFAVFSENKGFEARGYEEWRAVAGDAIQKFGSTKGLLVKFGPRSEDGSRYNIMAEFNRPIEVSPESKDQHSKQAKDLERKAKLAELEKLMKELHNG